MSEPSIAKNKHPRKYFHVVLLVIFAIREVVLFPALAAYLVLCLLGALGLTERMSPGAWFVAAPALYCLWVLTYLCLVALHTRFIFCRYTKPRRAILVEGARDSVPHFRLPICYARGYLVRSLPLMQPLIAIPWLRTLYLRAYSPSTKIGENVFLPGFLYDPDLTEIGNDVVLGGGCVIAAHAFANLRPDATIFISAPVRIGDRATIGAHSFIGLGVTVGKGAIVELASNVLARTNIGPGEVWGGNPAVFLRRRTQHDRR